MERITKKIISGNRLIPKFNVVPPLTVTETKEYFNQLKDYGIFEVEDVSTETIDAPAEIKVETKDITVIEEVKVETNDVVVPVEIKVQETITEEVNSDITTSTEKKGFSIKPTGLRKK